MGQKFKIGLLDKHSPNNNFVFKDGIEKFALLSEQNSKGFRVTIVEQLVNIRQ